MSEKASPENQNSELITEGLNNFFLGTQRRKVLPREGMS